MSNWPSMATFDRGLNHSRNRGPFEVGHTAAGLRQALQLRFNVR